jgi:hypothetical protein
MLGTGRKNPAIPAAPAANRSFRRDNIGTSNWFGRVHRESFGAHEDITSTRAPELHPASRSRFFWKIGFVKRNEK